MCNVAAEYQKRGVVTFANPLRVKHASRSGIPSPRAPSPPPPLVYGEPPWHQTHLAPL